MPPSTTKKTDQPVEKSILVLDLAHSHAGQDLEAGTIFECRGSQAARLIKLGVAHNANSQQIEQFKNPPADD